MLRFLPTLFAAALSLSVVGQEIPGVRVTMTAPRSTVTAGGNAELMLVIQTEKDAEVPADLLTGSNLEVKVDEKDAPGIVDAGKGGPVALAAGTRIERKLSIPVARLVPSLDASAFAGVSISWHGMAGTNCFFKVAPDTRNVDLAALDFAKTEVVLVTNHGEMTLGFRPDKAPNTVENFLKLVKSGFYDGTKFHRVIRNFMIQGGDPYTKDDTKQAMWGQGDPGYKINAEFNDIKHVRGTLSMARGNDVNSAGSQFFICHKEAPNLDNQYTAFGFLQSGSDTLDSIANTPVGGPAQSTPMQPVVLYSAILLPVKKS
ncbi:MAG TPA: peptidylprolyl isomerase [Planctomycetota bacterium]|nr:peptidylprolyl isomerase [Planctomycetota bacterium]